MAYFGRTEIGLKNTSTSCSVPDDPKAKLMYYLNCMCSVLQLYDDEDINRLRQYSNFRSLDESDTDLLVCICLLLQPNVLLNKCIFQDDGLCGNSSNEFYELQTVRNNLLVAGSVMIGGRQRRVQKIMAFKMSWLRENYTRPMEIMTARRQRQRAAIRARERESSSCAVM